MNESIAKFLKEQTCVSICCVDELGKPYCFTCFYAFDKVENLLHFKSSAESYHSVLLSKNPLVAGTVLPDKLNKLIIKGVQLEGVLLNSKHPFTNHASAYYHKKHPMALAMSGEIWTIQINSIKMTDSTLGFGKKILWDRKTEKESDGNQSVLNLNNQYDKN